MDPADCLQALNPEQRTAVLALDGPVEVLAGPGTGKSTLVAARVRHVVEARLARPREVLVLTTTNEQARTLLGMVAGGLGERVAHRVAIMTWHAFGMALLGDRPAVAGLRAGFALLPKACTRGVLADLLRVPGGRDGAAAVEAAEQAIARIKLAGVRPEDVEAWGNAQGPLSAETRAAARLYPAYQERLRAANGCDFADMILWAVHALADEPFRRDVAARYAQVLVDDHRHGSPVRDAVLAALARDHGALLVVGDDGTVTTSSAAPPYVAAWARMGWAVTRVALTTSYRCSPLLRAAARALLTPGAAASPGGVPHTADRWPPILVGEAASRFDEAAWMMAVAAEILAEDPSHTVFVCYRAHWHARLLEEAALTAGLPYALVGESFYARREVRDALAYLRLMEDPADRDAWARIADIPDRGLPERVRVRIQDATPSGGDLLAGAAALFEQGRLSNRAAAGVASLSALRQGWRAGQGDLADRLLRLLSEAGYLAWWRASGDESRHDRLDTLQELTRVAGECATAAALLARAARASDAATARARLVLRTLHGAQGLEATACLLPGWAEGMFPSAHALSALDARGGAALEEERRLAALGLMRARRYAVVSFVPDAARPGGPSRFLADLPADTRVLARVGALRGLVGRAPEPGQLEAATAAARARGVPLAPETRADAARLTAWLHRARAIQGSGRTADTP